MAPTEPDPALLLIEAFVCFRALDSEFQELPTVAVDAACTALVAGLDSPTLRELAGLYPDASRWEVDCLVQHTIDELGLDVPPPGSTEATRIAVRRRARTVVAGESDPSTLTSWIFSAFGLELPEDLDLLHDLAYRYEVAWALDNSSTDIDRDVLNLSHRLVDGTSGADEITASRSRTRRRFRKR